MAHLAGLNLPSSVTLLEAQIDKRKAAGQVCAPPPGKKQNILVQLGSLYRGSRRAGVLTSCGFVLAAFPERDHGGSRSHRPLSVGSPRSKRARSQLREVASVQYPAH